MDIDDVEVKQSIFVVEHGNNDLILGRLWERVVSAEYINEDDGLYSVKVKTPDGHRVVKSCVVKVEHERNREFARLDWEWIFWMSFFKMSGCFW